MLASKDQPCYKTQRTNKRIKEVKVIRLINRVVYKISVAQF